MFVGLTFISEGSIFSQTAEIIDEPNPQFFHPPSTTIKRFVFLTQLIIEEVSKGFITRISINSIVLLLLD